MRYKAQHANQFHYFCLCFLVSKLPFDMEINEMISLCTRTTIVNTHIIWIISIELAASECADFTDRKDLVHADKTIMHPIRPFGHIHRLMCMYPILWSGVFCRWLFSILMHSSDTLRVAIMTVMCEMFEFWLIWLLLWLSYNLGNDNQYCLVLPCILINWMRQPCLSRLIKITPEL